LVTDADDAAGEIDVVPGHPEHFGEPHIGVDAGEEQRSISLWASGEKACEL
jgi:hypothetical protein